MEFIKQAVPEVLLLKPKVFGDERGYFVETFRQDALEKALGYRVDFVQDNESKSSYGVLRGLHYQSPPFAQSKLVRVVDGTVLDVAVDIRYGSPTFGQAVTAVLSSENKHQLFVPRGFAHGFVVLSPMAIFAYKVDNYYAPDHDFGLAYDEPSLGIEWQIASDSVSLSEKDKNQPGLADLPCHFEYGVNYYG